jgi:hypothetical protein
VETVCVAKKLLMTELSRADLSTISSITKTIAFQSQRPPIRPASQTKRADQAEQAAYLIKVVM